MVGHLHAAWPMLVPDDDEPWKNNDVLAADERLVERMEFLEGVKAWTRGT